MLHTSRSTLLGVLLVVLLLHFFLQSHLQERRIRQELERRKKEQLTLNQKEIKELIHSFSLSLAEEEEEERERKFQQSSLPAECIEKPFVTFIIPSLFRMSLEDTISSLQRQSVCQWRAIVVYHSSRVDTDTHVVDVEDALASNTAKVGNDMTHDKKSDVTGFNDKHSNSQENFDSRAFWKEMNNKDVFHNKQGDNVGWKRPIKLATEPPEHFQLLPSRYTMDERVFFVESNGAAEVNFAGNMRNDALPYVAKDCPWVAFVDDDDILLPHYVESLQHEAKLNPDASVVLFRMLCSTCYTLVIPPPNHMNLVRSYAGISFALKRELVAPFGTFSFPTGSNEDYCMLYNIRNAGHTLVVSPTITYLVKGQQEMYQSELRRTNGGVSTGINRSAFWFGANSFPSDCAQKQLPVAAADKNSPNYLGFIFPESGHYIFQQNIDGLKRSLAFAADQGCLMAWLLKKMNIEIHFSYQTPIPKKRPFIQVQVEQIHNRMNMFTEQYVHKLKSALQVWTIAPTHYRFVQSYLQVKPTYFMPMWLMVDPVAKQSHTCRNQSLHHRYALTKRVRGDLSHSTGNFDELLEDCLIAPLGMSNIPPSEVTAIVRQANRKRAKRKEPLLRGEVRACPLPRVVMFGAIKGSDGDRRMRLCSTLQKKLSTSFPDMTPFECFHAIYGPSLDRVLCGAEVVVVDRFFQNGSIESHRIDPLLQMGKIIVSTHSRDVLMQKMYSEVVLFCNSMEELVSTLHSLLSDAELRMRLSQRSKQFIQKRVQLFRSLVITLEANASHCPLCCCHVGQEHSAHMSGDERHSEETD